MQNLLESAKKDIADGKDQRQKIRDKKLQGIQDQTAALKRDREEIAKISAEVSNASRMFTQLSMFPCFFNVKSIIYVN